MEKKNYTYKYNFNRYDIYGPEGYVCNCDSSKEAEERIEELEEELLKKKKTKD